MRLHVQRREKHVRDSIELRVGAVDPLLPAPRRRKRVYPDPDADFGALLAGNAHFQERDPVVRRRVHREHPPPRWDLDEQSLAPELDGMLVRDLDLRGPVAGRDERDAVIGAGGLDDVDGVGVAGLEEKERVEAVHHGHPVALHVPVDAAPAAPAACAPRERLDLLVLGRALLLCSAARAPLALLRARLLCELLRDVDYALLFLPRCSQPCPSPRLRALPPEIMCLKSHVCDLPLRPILEREGPPPRRAPVACLEKPLALLLLLPLYVDGQQPPAR
mmetsp:Transcript_44946/g.106611  ORF Transcript_44946/g.106611 Transcript_44946/m.106611 type:complete len:276 (-) Transcript_44946:105-932(-)